MLATAALASPTHDVRRREPAPAPQQQAPAPAGDADTEDLSHAVPASSASRMPNSADQYRALQSEIARSRPAVEDAKRRSDALNAQASALQQKLIATAAHVQDLEQQKIALDSEVSRLTTESAELSVSFATQRSRVAALLAILERMQHDMPPVMAIRSGDALAAAHASMLLGATVPRLYQAVTDLSRRLDAMKRTRLALIARRAEDVQNAAHLESARGQLDQLLAIKSREAGEASSQYGNLAGRLDAAANEAQSLEMLLQKVAALRVAPATQASIVVAARAGQGQGLRPHSLLRPVIGRTEPGDGAPQDALRAPGISFLAPAGAQVVAPADSQVLFAGPYHKNGIVLILHGVAGYDLVLAGLERVDVRAGDQVLAGEPVGRMPRSGTEMRLYFEMRQNGKGASPAPWLAVEPRKVM